MLLLLYRALDGLTARSGLRHQSTTLSTSISRKEKEEFEFAAFLTPNRARRSRGLFAYRQLSAWQANFSKVRHVRHQSKTLPSHSYVTWTWPKNPCLLFVFEIKTMYLLPQQLKYCYRIGYLNFFLEVPQISSNLHMIKLGFPKYHQRTK